MFKILTIITFLSTHILIAKAQKLANVQTASVWAPERVSIDGKFKEWGDKLQAHNYATDIFYTMANDEANLYLIAQVTNRDVVSKILRGGLSLLIQKNGAKNDKGALGITFPVADTPFSVALTTYAMGKADTSAENNRALMRTNNSLVARRIKSIRVNGIDAVDSILSIYNETGIKAACMFEEGKVYTLEMCLPLKYLELSAGDGFKFGYHIIINGYKPPNIGPITKADGTPATSAASQRLATSFEMGFARKAASTDFWGEYVLGKK